MSSPSPQPTEPQTVTGSDSAPLAAGTTPPERRPNTAMRLLWLACGWSSLGLGALGVVLPLLPTTPFVLLAAMCFARSSPALQRWLETNRHFGPMIADWRAHRSIARRHKAMALGMMGAAFALSVAMGLRPALLGIQAVCLGGAALFILSRPSRSARDG